MMTDAAITVIFSEDNKVLLLKRMIPQKDFEGLWGLPGGTIEDGETLEECAIREAKEEVGLQITNLKYVGIDRGFVWVYTTRNWFGNVKLDFEHTDFVWVTMEGLSNYNTIPGTTRFIKEALVL